MQYYPHKKCQSVLKFYDTWPYKYIIKIIYNVIVIKPYDHFWVLITIIIQRYDEICTHFKYVFNCMFIISSTFKQCYLAYKHVRMFLYYLSQSHKRLQEYFENMYCSKLTAMKNNQTRSGLRNFTISRINSPPVRAEFILNVKRWFMKTCGWIP